MKPAVALVMSVGDAERRKAEEDGREAMTTPRKKRETAAERDERIVREAGPWHSTPRGLATFNGELSHEWPNRYEDAAARILNRLRRVKR